MGSICAEYPGDFSIKNSSSAASGSTHFDCFGGFSNVRYIFCSSQCVWSISFVFNSLKRFNASLYFCGHAVGYHKYYHFEKYKIITSFERKTIFGWQSRNASVPVPDFATPIPIASGNLSIFFLLDRIWNGHEVSPWNYLKLIFPNNFLNFLPISLPGNDFQKNFK